MVTLDYGNASHLAVQRDMAVLRVRRGCNKPFGAIMSETRAAEEDCARWRTSSKAQLQGHLTACKGADRRSRQPTYIWHRPQSSGRSLIFLYGGSISLGL